MHWEANQCISIHMHAEFAYLYICTPRFRPRTCACISIHMHSKTLCFCMHIYTYAILDLHRLTYAFLDLHMYRYAFWRPSAHTRLGLESNAYVYICTTRVPPSESQILKAAEMLSILILTRHIQRWHWDTPKKKYAFVK